MRLFYVFLMVMTGICFTGICRADETLDALEKEMGKVEVVVMETNLGSIEIALFSEKAPITVNNFLQYVDDSFYNGTIFHRVIPDFMIQGGGMTPDLKPRETREPIKNEADNGLKNLRGTIAMARTGVVDSATSQFFINVVDNTRLDHVDNTAKEFGYAVFGKVISGMDVVDKIVSVERDGRFQDPEKRRRLFQNVPKEPVIIKSVRRK